MTAHWGEMAATDLFTAEVWIHCGLAAYNILVFINISTRALHIAGMTTAPNGTFMKRVARNLTDVSDSFLSNKEFRIMDRGTKFRNDFRGYWKREGVASVPCLARASKIH